MGLKISPEALSVFGSVCAVKDALKKATTGRAVLLIVKEAKSFDRFILPTIGLAFLSLFYVIFQMLLMSRDEWWWLALGAVSALTFLWGCWFFGCRTMHRLPGSEQFKIYDKSLGKFHLALRYLIFSSEMNKCNIKPEEYSFACRALNVNIEVSKSKGFSIGFWGAAIITTLTGVFANKISSIKSVDGQVQAINLLLGCFFVYATVKMFAALSTFTSAEKNFLMCLYEEELARRAAKREQEQANAAGEGTPVLSQVDAAPAILPEARKVGAGTKDAQPAPEARAQDHEVPVHPAG